MRKHAVTYAFTAVFCSAAGFLLRNLEIRTLLDPATMLMDFGSWSLILLILTAAALSVFVLLGRTLPKPAPSVGYTETFRSTPAVIVSVLTLVLTVLAGRLCLRRWQEGESGVYAILAGLMVLSGVGWIVLAAGAKLRRGGYRLWSAALPELNTCLFLILFYKVYAPQPALLYTLYPFLGLCAALAASHLIAGYTVQLCRPRLALFCCGAAAVLCVTAIPGVRETDYRLYFLALAMQSFLHGLYLFREPEPVPAESSEDEQNGDSSVPPELTEDPSEPENHD